MPRGSRGRPATWEARSARVSGRPFSGSRTPAGSSSCAGWSNATTPSSAMSASSVAVKTFVIDPISNSVRSSGGPAPGRHLPAEADVGALAVAHGADQRVVATPRVCGQDVVDRRHVRIVRTSPPETARVGAGICVKVGYLRPSAGYVVDRAARAGWGDRSRAASRAARHAAARDQRIGARELPGHLGHPRARRLVARPRRDVHAARRSPPCSRASSVGTRPDHIGRRPAHPGCVGRTGGRGHPARSRTATRWSRASRWWCSAARSRRSGSRPTRPSSRTSCRRSAGSRRSPLRASPRTSASWPGRPSARCCCWAAGACCSPARRPSPWSRLRPPCASCRGAARTRLRRRPNAPRGPCSPRDRRFALLFVAGCFAAIVYLSYETLMPISATDTYGLEPERVGRRAGDQPADGDVPAAAGDDLDVGAPDGPEARRRDVGDGPAAPRAHRDGGAVAARPRGDHLRRR